MLQPIDSSLVSGSQVAFVCLFFFACGYMLLQHVVQAGGQRFRKFTLLQSQIAGHLLQTVILLIRWPMVLVDGFS